jgi:hypothetical protein
MPHSSIKRIVIDQERLDRIADAFQLATDVSPGYPGVVRPGPANDGHAPGHLTDHEVIEYAADLMSYAGRERIGQHLRQCRDCLREVEELQERSSPWNNAQVVARLEGRIMSSPWRDSPPTAADARPESPRRPFRISLKPLVLPAGAYGEGGESEAPVVTFPVMENDREIEGLYGSLKRKNREFYIMISAAGRDIAERAGDRKVVITITDPDVARPLLKRHVDVSVAQLLGTDIRITTNSVVVAELAPADVDESA